VAHRAAIVALSICSSIALLCCFIDHPAAAALFGFSGLALIPALIALGAARRGRLGSLAAPLAILALLLAGSFTAMLVLPGTVATAVMLVGLWLLPLLLVSFLFAWDFRRFGLCDEDLRRLRKIAGKAADR
jgi:hypothetical protein